MTEREAIEAVLQRWNDGWTTLHPEIPWTTRGEVFSSEASWARISVQHSTAEQTTMGSAPSRKFERRGNIFVQLFVQENQGAGALADLAEDVRDVLEGQRLDGLTIYAGRTEEAPSDGVWAMAAVVLPFRYTHER